MRLAPLATALLAASVLTACGGSESGSEHPAYEYEGQWRTNCYSSTAGYWDQDFYTLTAVSSGRAHVALRSLRYTNSACSGEPVDTFIVTGTDENRYTTDPAAHTTTSSLGGFYIDFYNYGTVDGVTVDYVQIQYPPYTTDGSTRRVRQIMYLHNKKIRFGTPGSGEYYADDYPTTLANPRDYPDLIWYPN